MKRIAWITLLLLTWANGIAAWGGTKKSKVVKAEKGSITFVVDENLPGPEGHLRAASSSEQVAMWMLQEFGCDRNTPYGIVDKSFNDTLVRYIGADVLFKMFVKAYSEHRPIVLSPDDIWLIITQGVAQHINQNAETLRDQVVFHEGKITLTVQTNQLLLGAEDVGADPNHVKPVDWTEIFDKFVTQMEENTKGDIVSLLCADFTTTTVDSRIASQITIMNALQPYFNYEVMRVSCGIPTVTLKGTPEDWQKIVDRVKVLEQYELGWWTEKLIPILEEFVKASKGKPNKEFWRNMVTTIRPDEIRSGACSPVPPTMLDGWFLNFFPYDKHGKTPDKVSVNHSMLKEMLFADFKYKVFDDFGNLIQETPMQFYSGFIGVDEDPETYALTPRIGWLVRKTGNQPKDKEHWIKMK